MAGRLLPVLLALAACLAMLPSAASALTGAGGEKATVGVQRVARNRPSVTAAELAKNVQGHGWWYTSSYQGTKTFTLTFRYNHGGSGVFELGYPGNFAADPRKDNAGWSWPGEPGYPWPAGSGTLDEGTTIEQILKALAQQRTYTVRDPGTGKETTVTDLAYEQECVGVDFIVYGTYTVDEGSWEANGSRTIAAGYGAQETEVWTGEYHGNWCKEMAAPAGWKDKKVTIARGDGASTGPLVHLKSKSSHPVHARAGVVIDNGPSAGPAVLVEDGALLMMECDARITGDGSVGTGVYLDKGGSVEFFGHSKVEHMDVAVEQKDGQTRLKDSPDPFGTANGNRTGVALWPGQTIGKWTEALSSDMRAVPIYLRELDKWKSGDIVMDSGRWWYDEIYKGGPHNEMYGAVGPGDLGSGKFYFQNPGEDLSMALAYDSGGKPYTSGTVTNYGGDRQVVAPGERYPVIRFVRSTVYNVDTNTWYRTLYDAVTGSGPMGPGAGRTVRSGDVLVFYGSTTENRTVTIPRGVEGLTIRTSAAGEMPGDERSGSACAAGINAGIVVEDGAGVAIQGGGAGGLTLAGAKDVTIIANDGALDLKDGVSLVGGQYAVDQNGTFGLYGGVAFEGNGTADVRLEAGNRHITLQTTAPATDVRVELADQEDGRDVVLEGDEIKGSLGSDYLARFRLVNLRGYGYVYNHTGGPEEKPVLELTIDQPGSGAVLPRTGGAGTEAYAAAGLAAALPAGLALVGRRKRR